MYKIGFCPQCDTQIMVADCKGRWNTIKPNYRQIDLTFDDGHRVRTIICKDCLEHPDYDKLLEAITCEESEACTHDVKKMLQAKNEKHKIKAHCKADAPNMKVEVPRGH